MAFVCFVCSVTPHLTRLLVCLVYDIQPPVHESTLDATIKLLCAVVRGIIQRKDPFVFKLRVSFRDASRLVEFEGIAKDKCAVTKTEYNFIVLELKPHCEYP